MAIPEEWHGANMILGAPEGDESVSAMPAFQNDAMFVTFWRFTPADIEYINKTGGIMHSSFTGGGPPYPVLITNEDEMRAFAADYGGVWEKKE